MAEQNTLPEISPLSNTLFFTSIKNLSFDYTLPLKSSLNRFCREQRGEASKNLFEYICYKLVQKQITTKGINEQIAIISEKFLSTKECIANLSKLNSSQKKFILIPIYHSVTHKWNAIIFVHLERQILQYFKKTSTEPIVAKIISSNINSEEDDYLLNTTMDKIENAFNFTSPEDIQFEVDSINICDQPNTSVFLLNFIEGLINQENDTDKIMNYIMKLYDESSNTNSIGSNNYFVSFNKENEMFQNLIENYINEIKIYAKVNGLIKDDKNNDEKNSGDKNAGEKKIEEAKNDETKNEDINNKEKKDEDINQKNVFDLINFQPEEEDEMESEEEAFKIVAKDNEMSLKQMEEQELFFSNNMNPPFNVNMEEINNLPPKTILGLIQEVENESDEDTEQKNEINNNSLIKKNEVESNTEEEEDNNNELKISIDNQEKKDMKEKQENKKDKEDLDKKDIQEDKENKIIEEEKNNKDNKENKEDKINIDNSNNDKKENEINSKKITTEDIKEKEEEKEKEKDNINIKKEVKKEITNIENIENIENKKGKVNKINKNIIPDYRNIQSENIVNKNMSKLSNNLDKIKNEIINNLSKENKNLRGSHGLKNNTLEKLKLITEGNPEKILSKSLTNSNEIFDNKKENTNTYSVINLQRNQKYNNSSFYVSKGSNSKSNKNNNNEKNKQNEDILKKEKNTNYSEEKSNKINDNNIKEQKKETKKDINDIKNENNHLIYESNYNQIKDINSNLINSINEENIKNIKKITGQTEIKTNTQISQQNKNISQDSNINNNYKKGKNTIIINETSNNNTVINFIEIKNNFESNNSNSDNENEIPEDGVINKIIETFSPNKTLSGMKKGIVDDEFSINKNKTYRGKPVVNFDIFSESRIKNQKLTLLNDYLYGDDNLNSEDNNINNDINLIKPEKEVDINIEENNFTIKDINNKDINNINNINNNGNSIPKRMSKRLKYRGGPEKKKLILENGENVNLINEYKNSNNCSLNMAKDLNCGCAGVNDGCFIF